MPNNVKHMLDEMLYRIRQFGVCRHPHVAKYLAIRVYVEVAVEDATWLRNPDYGAHINAAELERVMTINMTVKWKLIQILLQYVTS